MIPSTVISALTTSDVALFLGQGSLTSANFNFFIDYSSTISFFNNGTVGGFSYVVDEMY